MLQSSVFSGSCGEHFHLTTTRCFILSWSLVSSVCMFFPVVVLVSSWCSGLSLYKKQWGGLGALTCPLVYIGCEYLCGYLLCAFITQPSSKHPQCAETIVMTLDASTFSLASPPVVQMLGNWSTGHLNRMFCNFTWFT